ncbi:MAG: aminopeptidase P family protein [Planctomycetes bacterium]|nr:aminopeptidase P family protein [Planctomycetota bacterium]
MAGKKKRGPSPEIKVRLTRCRRQIKSCGASALLLYNHVDCFYLTGFTGDESAVLVTAKDVHIISDGRFEGEVAKEVPWATTWMRRGMLNDEIVKACKSLKIKNLAIQPGHCSVGDHAELKGKLKGVRLIPAPPIVASMRIIKSASELAALRKAIKIAEDAFRATRQTIRIGQTETEMAARLEYEMKRRGASAPAFSTICAEGANGAIPHAVPGTRKVRKGSSILFDWGARVGRYNSDLTRMVFFGSIPQKIEEIYGVVLKAQIAATKAIRPGVRMCDVDAVARKIVGDAGFGERFTHGLGHGLGLEVHEGPSLSWRSKEKLAPGMVVTVEPGIYLPRIGGVRIEDDVLVTKTGHRVLTSFNKTLRSAVI